VLWPAAAIASFLTVAASRGTPVNPDPGGGLLPAADGRAVLAHLHRLADAVPAWCLAANPIDIAERLSSDDGFSYVPLTCGYSRRPGARSPRPTSSCTPGRPGYDKVRFVRPVFIGDTITVTATITATREHPKQAGRYGFADEQVTVRNQHGEVVLSLVHVYLVERQPPSPPSPKEM
jgi:hypothetical protein